MFSSRCCAGLPQWRFKSYSQNVFGEPPNRYTFGARRFLHRAVCKRLGKACFAFPAPRTDNFKVTFYSRGFHQRFLRDYEVFRLILEVDLEVNLANLQEAALHRYRRQLELFNSGESTRKNPPRIPSASTGVRSNLCGEIRGIGRTLMDAKVLIFGLGRGDLRDTFVAAYCTLAQNNSTSMLVKVACQNEMITAMQGAIIGIGQLAGALRMLCTFVYNRDVCPRRWSASRHSMRLHVFTFAWHYCWRFIPSVVKVLPDLLVRTETGHLFKGLKVNVSASKFVEPGPRQFPTLEARRAHFRMLRTADAPVRIWSRTIEALDELARMLRMEVIEVRARLFHWSGSLTDVDAAVRPRPGPRPGADDAVGPRPGADGGELDGGELDGASDCSSADSESIHMSEDSSSDDGLEFDNAVSSKAEGRAQADAVVRDIVQDTRTSPIPHPYLTPK
jgi:hypothetical protein